MQRQTDAREVDLRDYLDVLRRRRWTIALAFAIVTGVALTSSLLQTPRYQGTAKILLEPRNGESLFDPTSGQRIDPKSTVDTEIEVLKSEPVRQAVRKELGSAPPVSARPVRSTAVLEVSARHEEAETAAAIANAYAGAYIEFRRKQAVDGLLSAAEQVQTKVSEIQSQIRALDERLAETPASQRATVDAGLRAERDALVEQQALFKQKLDQLQVETSLKSGGAQIVTEATVPKQPAEPRPRRSAFFGGFLGLLFGVGVAFAREYLDDSIKSKEDVARLLPDIPVLGLVPAVAAWRDQTRPQVVSVTEPTSTAAEAYRSLRTSIQFMALDRPMRTLQVTSPNAGEGKTTTLSNLAVALARAGQRVIVVCCDLRRPRVHEFFWLTNEIGFTSVLLGEIPLSAAIQSVPGEDRVKLLASGPAPPNPSELLGGRRAVELFTALQAECDIVLIDSPPVLPVTDAAVLSSRVDATLLVATAGGTTQKELHRAHELLKQVDAPMIGTVLNGISADSAYGYAHQYKYYAKDEPSSGKRQRRKQGQSDKSQPASRRV